MSRHESQLWQSLVARLNATDMTEEDLRECSVAIQRQILADIGFDGAATAQLMAMMRERAASGSPRRDEHSSPFANAVGAAVFTNRQPGSVEWDEVEQACAEVTPDLVIEVRNVSSIPPATIPAAEKEFRTARLETGSQPERLFRFCSKRHIDRIADTCSIFDSFVDGFDIAVSRHGQAIGRTLVPSFSAEDLTRYGETCAVLGVDALVMKPVVMTVSQFTEWCANITDSAEAHSAIVEHGATCVQVEDDGSIGGSEGAGWPRLIVFDTRVVILRVMASIRPVRDSFHCAPGAIATRGCTKHGNRKFEFWCSSKKRLLCSFCLFNEPELRSEAVIVDEAFGYEMSQAQLFRDTVKSRQHLIGRTMSSLDSQHDSYPDRTEALRVVIDDTFAEIRRLVDLQEADTASAFELSIKMNAENLANSSDAFRRFEQDADAYLRDANEAINARDPVRVLGVAQAAATSTGGATLPLGNAEEHARTFELPELRFDKEAFVRALRSAVVLRDPNEEQQRRKDEAEAKNKNKQAHGDDGEFEL